MARLKKFRRMLILLPILLIVLGFVFTLWGISWLLFFFGWLDFSNEHQKIGISFSPQQAWHLGLDPKRTLSAFLENGVRYLRLSAYWSEIEREKGSYDFSNLDWQIEMAQHFHAHVILAIGMRVPRWPECHLPEWFWNLSDEERREKLLSYLEKVVMRYGRLRSIEMFQVENEAFFDWREIRRAGSCPKFDKNLLFAEIMLVHSLSRKQVVITDTGEFSWWKESSRAGDIFGTTLYRALYFADHPLVSHIPNPMPPLFYLFRKWWQGINSSRFFVMELQAEPWIKPQYSKQFKTWQKENPSKPIFLAFDVQTQLHAMSMARIQNGLRFTRSLGSTRIYLWGAEWSYWLCVIKNECKIWKWYQEMFRNYSR